MLELEHVSCGYGREDVIRDVSFSMKSGESLAVLGVNGCGKTTLLRAICGILPARGTIRIRRRELHRMKRREIAREVALLSQMSQVYFPYSVYETVMLGRYLFMKDNALTLPSVRDRDAVMHCLETLAILDIKDQPITQLSGGQLQRVYLARIFAQEPSIILLDEPTNHLDLKNQLFLLEYLREWAREEGHLLIGVLHDVNFALTLSDQVLLLHEGRVAKMGKTAEVLNSGEINRAYGLDVREAMQGLLGAWKDIEE